jgi:hypothetical protein
MVEAHKTAWVGVFFEKPLETAIDAIITEN